MSWTNSRRSCPPWTLAFSISKSSSSRSGSRPKAFPPAARPKSGRDRQSSIDNVNGNSKFKIGKFAIPSLQRSKSKPFCFISFRSLCISSYQIKGISVDNTLSVSSLTPWHEATSDGSIASNQSLENIHSRLQSSFTKLKDDKEKAFQIMRSEIEKWEKNGKQFRFLLNENESLSAPRPGSTVSRQALEEAYIARTSVNSDRTHSFTSSITGSDVFYDADDTVLTADLSSADLSDFEGDGQGDDNDNSSDEDWVEERAKAEKAAAKEAAPTAAAAGGSGVDEPIVRRSALPAPVSGEDISLLSILRKNVGKDLATVAMPVSLNEPINVLQRLCEELEYSELLDKAAGLSDSLDRLVYVAAFAVSGYATTQWRAARKPFNPLHGETFEYNCPEKGMPMRHCFFIVILLSIGHVCRRF